MIKLKKCKILKKHLKIYKKADNRIKKNSIKKKVKKKTIRTWKKYIDRNIDKQEKKKKIR